MNWFFGNYSILNGLIINQWVQMVNPRTVPAENASDICKKFLEIEGFFCARLIA
ncbi:MAG: hypothetical protein CM1200mP30_22600 [Pseudomonadota bacterium]|nr:MAG: hypothetical protein CM1200mP30_22600 [Pseudomonadota bacterium]